MYVSMYLCIYVSMYLCIYVSIYLSIYLFIYLFLKIKINDNNFERRFDLAEVIFELAKKQ